MFRLNRFNPLKCRFIHSKSLGPEVVSADEAVSIVNSFSRVYVHGVSAVPITLLNALAKRASELKHVELLHLHLDIPNPCATIENRDAFFTNNLFIGANQRKLVDQGVSSYIPVFLSEMPKLLRIDLKPDVTLLNLSPPHGYCSLGTEVACAGPASSVSKTIIAQINPNVPRTHGSTSIHYSKLDYVVECNDELPSTESAKIGEVEKRIGRVISELIPDGATIQMGIGGIPDAVLSQLHSHKNLGIHTEMFAEVDLLTSGVITNKNKIFLPDKTLTSFVTGSKRLYDYVNDNPTISFMDASVTNNPHTIGSNPMVVAINSAIEVDITGQVCADSIGSFMVSGVGGQIDFERGAGISKGGIPIIALPSITKNGDSRIVSFLKPGAGVITTRYHVHFVVTEYGFCNLFGLNIHQRAKALIEIAHPKHREQLEKDTFERFKIKSWI